VKEYILFLLLPLVLLSCDVRRTDKIADDAF